MKTAGAKATIDLNELKKYRLFPFHYLFCKTSSSSFRSKRMEHDRSQIFTGFPYAKVGSDDSYNEQGIPTSDNEGSVRYGSYRIIIKNQG